MWPLHQSLLAYLRHFQQNLHFQHLDRQNSDVNLTIKNQQIQKIRKLILTANAQQNTLKQTQQQHHFWLQRFYPQKKSPNIQRSLSQSPSVQKNSINSVNSIGHSSATTEARTNPNTDPESQFPAEHIKTTNKAPQSMVLEISRLFRLKSRVPK